MGLKQGIDLRLLISSCPSYPQLPLTLSTHNKYLPFPFLPITVSGYHHLSYWFHPPNRSNLHPILLFPVHLPPLFIGHHHSHPLFFASALSYSKLSFKLFSHYLKDLRFDVWVIPS